MLTESLSAILDIYRRHHCPADWKALPFSATQDGAVLTLHIDDREGIDRTVEGAWSAFPMLAGRYWAATLAQPEFESHRAWIRSLGSMMPLERDAEEILIDAGLDLLDRGETTEAIACLERALFKSNYDAYEPADTAATTSARERFFSRPRARAHRATLERIFRERSVCAALAGLRGSRTASLERLTQAFADADAAERALIAIAAEAILDGGDVDRAPGYFAVIGPILLTLARDAAPYVQERALAAIEKLSAMLWLGRFYPAALVCSELLAEYGINRYEHLRIVWACRVRLGEHERAAIEWPAIKALPHQSTSFSLDGTYVNHGDVVDFFFHHHVPVWSRRVFGGDGLPFASTIEEHARFAAPAMTGDVSDPLVRGGLADADPVIRERVRQSIPESLTAENNLKSYQEDFYVLTGLLAEHDGHLDAAAQCLNTARILLQLRNHSPSTRLFLLAHLDRVRARQLGVEAATSDPPDDYDPARLQDQSLRPRELEDALARWARMPWLRFPRTADEARGSPLAPLLIRALDQPRAYTFEAGARQLHVYRRFMPLALCSMSRRLLTWERSSLTDAHRVAFGVAENHLSEKDVAARVGAFNRWIAALQECSTGEDSVLTALPDAAFQRIADWLNRVGPSLDLERWVLQNAFHATGRLSLSLAFWKRFRRFSALEKTNRALPPDDWQREAVSEAAEPSRELADVAWMTVEEIWRDPLKRTPPAATALWLLPFAWHASLEDRVLKFLGQSAGRDEDERHSRTIAVRWLADAVRSEKIRAVAHAH